MIMRVFQKPMLNTDTLKMMMMMVMLHTEFPFMVNLLE